MDTRNHASNPAAAAAASQSHFDLVMGAWWKASAETAFTRALSGGTID
jgi:hypothetical protein